MDNCTYIHEKRNLWLDFNNNIIKKPVYWLCVMFMVTLSYFFDLANRTVSIDDLSRTLYIGDGNRMIMGTRWGKTLWLRLLTNCEYTPFIDKFLGIIFFLASAVLFSRTLYIYFFDNRYKLTLITLFSCFYVSYPLINEIWNYNDSNVVLAANSVVVAWALLYLRDGERIFDKKTWISSVLLSIVASSYESSVFLYISAVLSIVLMDYILFGKKNWLLNGLRYAVPLVLAVALRFLIGFGLIKIMGLKYQSNGATEIAWGSEGSFFSQFVSMLRNTLDFYGLRCLIYFPITVFVIAALLGLITMIVFAVKRKSAVICLIGVLLYISLFFQSLLQGTMMPYRTAQTLQYFCAFSFTMFLYLLTFTKRRANLTVCLILLSYLCYRQGVFMNRALALNNQRSDNEAAIARDIGSRLKSMYDNGKTVIFVGNLDIGEYINAQMRQNNDTIGGFLYHKIAAHLGWAPDIRKVYQTNINSVMIWSEYAHNGQRLMGQYFSYLGYDIKVLNNNDIYKYWLIAIQEEMKPLEIRDMGEYILVFLG